MPPPGVPLFRSANSLLPSSGFAGLFFDEPIFSVDSPDGKIWNATHR
jgi:hypothetical protein